MDQNAKPQIIERLKQANNILVTVRSNPSVDQLASCIGLTLLLNKLGKHATAVFSGQVPSILEFLQPEMTIEQDTNSLRDFIIALDKSKADKLRYKVEENVVRIFITPFRTSLTEKDFDFSQGDFNVDAVVALGVLQREDLDQAITAHGRILHDATVITINNGQNAGSLGAINWIDSTASSLSEMLVTLVPDLGQNLLDEQMSTAFLTGIVAETERFSNPKTTPRVMTMSAQLMATGANQQLIANKLENAVEIDHTAGKDNSSQGDGSSPDQTDNNQVDNQPKPDGELTIDHNASAGQAAVLPPPQAGGSDESPLDEEPKSDINQVQIDEHGNPIFLNTPAEEAKNENIDLPLADQTPKLSPDQEGGDKSIDPLSQTDNPSYPKMPLLSHDSAGIMPTSQSAAQDTADTQPLAGPGPELQAQATSNASSINSTVDDGKPAIRDNETLQQIEEAVGSDHLKNLTEVDKANSQSMTPIAIPPAPDPSGQVQPTIDHLDSARDAVFSAINASPDLTPQRLQGVGSSPLGGPLHGNDTPVPDPANFFPSDPGSTAYQPAPSTSPQIPSDSTVPSLNQVLPTSSDDSGYTVNPTQNTEAGLDLPGINNNQPPQPDSPQDDNTAPPVPPPLYPV